MHLDSEAATFASGFVSSQSVVIKVDDDAIGGLGAEVTTVTCLNVFISFKIKRYSRHL